VLCHIAGFGPPHDYLRLDGEGLYFVFQRTGLIYNNDFFFSGHTAAPFLFFLFSEGKLAKGVFLVGTILMATSVLLLHHHYTIDVVTAPIFTWAVYSGSKKILGITDKKRGELR
jgi:hypothetical protein